MDVIILLLSKLPQWLVDFDHLSIPTWSVVVAIALSGVAAVLAGREFFAWFFKTNVILDELSRVDRQILSLEADLRLLGQTVKRLEDTAAPIRPAPTSSTESPNRPPQFPLSH